MTAKKVGGEMKWQEVVERSDLQNLPFKLELDETGKVLMSPVKVYHSAFQGEIGFLLRSLRPAGRVLSEGAITTRKGTKVADVAWASQGKFETVKHETECSQAPEVCVEVISSSKTEAEIKEKQGLYFEKGANEVWLCREDGEIQVVSPAGRLAQSILFPTFPPKVNL